MIDPHAVLACYAWERPPVCRYLGNRGGFSGASLWRVDDASGAYCLKLWPAESMSLGRLTAIHALLQRAAASGVDFVTCPVQARDQTTVIEHGGRVWDLSTWLPGAADFQQQPTVGRLESACAALAQLHAAWTPATPRRGPCPAVMRRLDAFQAWQELALSGWRPQPGPDDPVREWAEQAWTLLQGRVGPAIRDLQPWLGRDVPLHPCWCDPWHDNLLFTGDRLTGLIDHGSIKEDHAAADLSRLLGSLVADDIRFWQRGLEAYRAVRPFSDADVPLISLLDETGLVASAVNWLRWLYHEQRTYADRHAVAERLRGIVCRMVRTERGGFFLRA